MKPRSSLDGVQRRPSVLGHRQRLLAVHALQVDSAVLYVDPDIIHVELRHMENRFAYKHGGFPCSTFVDGGAVGIQRSQFIKLDAFGKKFVDQRLVFQKIIWIPIAG